MNLMNSLVCFQEGNFLTIDQSGLNLNDLGIQRGYGIFDFLRTTGNKALFIDDHLDRFFYSSDKMRLPIGYTRDQLKSIVYELIDKNQLSYSGMRILLTGGASSDGYTITLPRLAIIQQEMDKLPEQLSNSGIHLITKEFQRQLSDVKTTDYLMAIWLQPWMKEQNGDDLLYYNENSITECPRSNIFMVTQDGILVTPKQGMLKGITRKNIIKIADAIGLTVEERDIQLEELHQAKEVFISSSTKRLVPVAMIDNKHEYDVTKNNISRKIWDTFLDLEHGI
jgi:D-alanine transaminase/branched-chain amino acid aminotransferase